MPVTTTRRMRVQRSSPDIPDGTAFAWLIREVGYTRGRPAWDTLVGTAPTLPAAYAYAVGYARGAGHHTTKIRPEPRRHRYPLTKEHRP